MDDGRQFRIYPSKAQATMFSQWIGCQRVIQNAKVDEVEYLLWQRRRAIFNGLSTDGEWAFDQKYSHFKTDVNPWLGEVPSQVNRNGIYRAKAAYTRYWAGLGGVPHRRKKSTRESVLLTSELFQFRDKALFIGSVKKPKAMQRIPIKSHRPFGNPNMIAIVRDGSEWYVSFSFSDLEVVLSNEELTLLHADTKEEDILALDMGVVHPLFDSNGCTYDMSDGQLRKVAQFESRIECLQKKLSRQKKGSKRRADTKQLLSRVHQKKRRFIGDWRHKVTFSIAKSAGPVVALEDLRLKNMTAAPKPKPQTPTGQFPANGAAAKAGLNRVMLLMGLGILSTQLLYKLNRRAKALLFVPPQRSSQECSKCTHTSPDNRRTQAEFHCQACGFLTNADYNAGLVLRKRARVALQSACPMGNMATLNAREATPEKPPA